MKYGHASSMYEQYQAKLGSLLNAPDEADRCEQVGHEYRPAADGRVTCACCGTDQDAEIVDATHAFTVIDDPAEVAALLKSYKDNHVGYFHGIPVHQTPPKPDIPDAHVIDEEPGA